MFTDGWMNKGSLVYAYNGILFSPEKWDLAICNHVEGP